MCIDNVLFVFTSCLNSNLLTVAKTYKLGLIIKDKANNSSIKLITIAKRITDVNKLLNHNKTLAKSDI